MTIHVKRSTRKSSWRVKLRRCLRKMLMLNYHALILESLLHPDYSSYRNTSFHYYIYHIQSKSHNSGPLHRMWRCWNNRNSLHRFPIFDRCFGRVGPRFRWAPFSKETCRWRLTKLCLVRPRWYLSVTQNSQLDFYILCKYPCRSRVHRWLGLPIWMELIRWALHYRYRLCIVWRFSFYNSYICRI